MSEKGKDYKGKLFRLFRLILLLYRKPGGLTIKEIQKRVDTSWRTIYRDIELLRQSGFLIEEVSKGRWAVSGMSKQVSQFEDELSFTAAEAALLEKASHAIPSKHPLKSQITNKLKTFSSMDDIIDVFVKHDRALMTEELARAIQERKVVVLKNYRSGNSQTILDRKVEPIRIGPQGETVKCLDLNDGKNKTFKIDRMESVEVLLQTWTKEELHEKEILVDPFGFSGKNPIEVKFRMSLRAMNLLKEEYPNSIPFVKSLGNQTYLFQAKLNGFHALGRFIGGLVEEIDEIEPKTLLTFLRKKYAKRSF